MKTIKTHQFSFSRAENKLEFQVPESWHELNQEQLRYVFFLLSSFNDLTVIKTYMFMRFTGIEVDKVISGGARCYIRKGDTGRRHFFNLATWQIQSLIHHFDFVGSCDGLDVRLDNIRGYYAVDVFLRGVCFSDYLMCEKNYQDFLGTRDKKYLNRLGRILYRDSDNQPPEQFNLNGTEQTAIFYWYTSAKNMFSRQFSDFFKPVPDGKIEQVRFIKLANAQIRALTDGDITKEKEIGAIDCWRALTELNEKAREAEEFNRKFGKNV
ncbi:MAG: hypothetical protein LKE54_04430 [Prevotella sp.]|jgi:hypothetical protein|nr:hypothetical protein [Prevotella sp.]MCH3994289.1 hypothetical protein [Prevotella sp.]